ASMEAEHFLVANSPPRKRLRSAGSTSPSGSDASSSSPLSERSVSFSSGLEVPLPFVSSLARRLQIQNRRPPASAANTAAGDAQRRARRARRVTSAPTVRTPNNKSEPAIFSTGPRDVFDMTTSPLLNMEAAAEARHRRTFRTTRANNSAANAQVPQRRRSAGDAPTNVVNNTANIQAGQRQQRAGNGPSARVPGSPSPAQRPRLPRSTIGQSSAINIARPRASRNLPSPPNTPTPRPATSQNSPSTRSIRSAAPTPPESASTALETVRIEAHEATNPQTEANRTQHIPGSIAEIMEALERLQVRAEEEPSADLDRQISDLFQRLRLLHEGGEEQEEDDSWIAD
ncbi:MAG: hypothetical protein Q9174_006866, partial [Haloplaca sp. 1 TL-2023]